MNHAIRSAHLDDAPAICTVLRRSILECCRIDHRDDPAVTERWLRNKTVAQVEAWLRDENRFGIVAVEQKLIVGTGMLSRGGEVLLCYVLPEVRFKGVGSAMLSALEAKARQQGSATLHLDSTQTALPFYLGKGFKCAGEEKSVWGLTARSMRKDLQPPHVAWDA